MGIDSSTPLPQYIATLIQTTVQMVVGWYRLTESDRDDLEQQIVLEVVRRRVKFDAGKEAKEKTFLARVVTHALSDIIRARRASNRDYRRENGSLDQWVRDDAGDWALRGEAITEDDAGRHLGRPGTPRAELRDLALDMAEAASRLSPPLREIFEHFAALGSVREVAKATGLHHTSVYEALRQIKVRFEEAGLGAYLPNSRWVTRQIRRPAGM